MRRYTTKLGLNLRAFLVKFFVFLECVLGHDCSL